MGGCGAAGGVVGGPLRVPSGQASTGSGRTVRGARVRRGVGDAMGDGDAPRPALDSRVRGNDDGGVWGVAGVVCGGGECPQDRLRQAQGERCRGVSLRRGVGDAMGGGDAPRPCPGFPRSRERRWGGVGCGGGCLWWGEGPAAAGRAVREPPLRGLGSPGIATGVWVGVPRAGAPALDSRVRGNDDGGCGVWRGLLVVGGGPSGALRTGFDRLRANGFGKCACRGEWGMRWGWRRPAPRPSGFLPSQE